MTKGWPMAGLFVYDNHVDFLSALKQSKWIRRSIWPAWIVIRDSRNTSLVNLSREDLLAMDWEPSVYEEERDDDDAAKRFSLLELY